MNSIFERIPIVDVDAHITEPYDLWTSRVASKWGDQVPHVIKAPARTSTTGRLATVWCCPRA